MVVVKEGVLKRLNNEYFSLQSDHKCISCDPKYPKSTKYGQIRPILGTKISFGPNVDNDQEEILSLFPPEEGANISFPVTPLRKKVVREGREEGLNEGET